MAGIAKRVGVVIMVIFCTIAMVSGCYPNTQEGSRRRRRATAPEADDTLARFFGNCQPLVKASRGVLQSLPSVVDYSIRDTNWYKTVSSRICTGREDVAECWIYALDFLLDPSSVFFRPTAKCICDWAGTCFTPPASISKRHVESGGRHGDCPSKNKKPNPLTRDEKTFSTCLETEVRRFRRQYPSLRRFEGTSVTIFLKDHYTFCRTIPNFPYSQRNLFQLLYIDQVCPRFGSAAAWRRNVLDVYREATRTDGPLWPAVDTCATKKPSPCEPNPCRNGGKCREVNNPFTYLESSNPFHPGPPSPPAGYRCECRRGYSGKNCEIKEVCEDVWPWCTYSNPCRTSRATQCKKTCGHC